MMYLDLNIDLEKLKKEGGYYAFSKLQQAEVQFCLYDGEVFVRHCGIGKGCYFTEFQSLGNVQ